MNLRQSLKTIKQLWQNQANLKILQDKHSLLIARIESDTKRTNDEKKRAKNELIKQQAKIEIMINEIKLRLHAEKNPFLDNIVDGKTSDIHPTSMKEKNCYTPLVYQTLLPVMQLAYSFENNGNAEEHAFRLACFFNKKEDAIHYLNHYADSHAKTKDLVHDACLLTPPNNTPHQQRWLTLARQNHGENLLNPTFVKLLGLSQDIELQIEKDKKNQNELFNSMKETKGELTKKIKLLKNFCDKFAAGQIPRTEEHKKLNAKNLIKLQALYSSRSILHLVKPFEQYTIQDIEDTYQRILLKDPIKVFFTKHGINDANYQHFQSLDRSQASKNIPNVFIKLDHGFYIKKLNVQNIKEAAIGACLGKLSNCCQSISGEVGEPCAIHGLTNPDSGFYVLFKGNPAQPDIENDIVFGQTWVNRTQSGMLVFDSIESKQARNNPSIKSIVISAYRQLANTLTQSHGISKVQCGASSGISKKVGVHSNYCFINETPKDYNHYRDSHKQLFLADTASLFNLGSKGLLLDEKRWCEELQQCNKIKRVTDKMRYAIGFAVANHLTEAIQKFKDQHILKEYVDIQECFLEGLNEYEQICKLYADDSDDESEGLEPIPVPIVLHDDCDINILSKAGLSVLMFAALCNHTELVDKLIALKANPNFTIQGKSALMMAAACKGHKNIVTALVSAKSCLDLQDESGYTALMEAAQIGNTELVTLLAAAKANIDLQNNTQVGSDYNALMFAASRGDHETVIALIKANANLDLETKEKHTALMKAVLYGHHNSKAAIALINAKAQLDLRSRGYSALMLAANYQKKEILAALIDAKAELNFQNDEGETALIHATRFNRLGIVELLLAAKAKLDLEDKRGQTALMLAKEKYEKYDYHYCLTWHDYKSIECNSKVNEIFFMLEKATQEQQKEFEAKKDIIKYGLSQSLFATSTESEQFVSSPTSRLDR